MNRQHSNGSRRSSRAGPLSQNTIALHDAQFVLAREYGFKSWNDLREEVEARSLSFSAAVDEFVRCATGNAQDRALRLLARHAGVAHASLFTELVLGDAQAAEARVKANAEAARQRGGVQNWEPLLYVCHTCLHEGSPERSKGLVKIARELLRLGANPNAEYDWNWHPELPRTALWGALIAMGHLELAEVLLESGANPTDGVSMHIASGSGNVPALELLHRFGAQVNGISGGVPPLAYITTKSLGGCCGMARRMNFRRWTNSFRRVVRATGRGPWRCSKSTRICATSFGRSITS